ncbi:MAG: site-2 protease family protein [Cytophagales bacterium]|nr:site-2 protease family protein [Armatimonadota bacterium]
MGYLTTALTFILIFATLVFFHELGHFLLAKFFKMRVDEFALGMGRPKLRLFSDGETEYTLRAIPIGGFVRIAGMEIEDAYESRLTGTGRPASGEGSKAAGLEGTNVGTMRQEADEVSGVDPAGFNSRPIYQRFLVILAGPVFSFLLGWVALCSVGFLFGTPDKTTLKINNVIAGGPAARAGMQNGDTFVSINGRPIEDGAKLLTTIRESAGTPLRFRVRTAGGQERAITVTPQSGTIPGEAKPVGQIKIEPKPVILTSKRVGITESIQQGNADVLLWFQTLGKVFASGKLKDNVGGPVAIVRQTHMAVDLGGGVPLSFLGQLSLSLGFFNLLPVPILDGGHLALMALEAIRRRKLSAVQTQRVFTAGFALLCLLFVYVMFKDLFLAG